MSPAQEADDIERSGIAVCAAYPDICDHVAPPASDFGTYA
jgi:hypothetical protein